MRLICPNCDAEYEVDGDQISSEGRDVQCSNCAHTWLQMPEGFDDTPIADPPNESETLDLDADDEDVTDTGFMPPDGVEMQRRRTTADPDALNVIHEEVQHEMRHRDAEAGSIETQTELGLDQSDFAQTTPSPEPDDTLQAIQKMRSEAQAEESEDAAALAGLAPAQRRSDATKSELLPDIEEINSTLAAAPDPVYDEEGNLDVSATTGERRGFRLGFGLMLLLTALLLLFYAYAPAIAERFPQYQAQIEGFVGIIDGLRAALDKAAQSLLQRLNAMLEGFSN